MQGGLWLRFSSELRIGVCVRILVMESSAKLYGRRGCKVGGKVYDWWFRLSQGEVVRMGF